MRQLLIEGEWRKSNILERRNVIAPQTGKTLDPASRVNQQDLRKAITIARDAQGARKRMTHAKAVMMNYGDY